MPFWVQCHNIHLAFMYAPIIHSIGERIGRALEVEAGDDGRCKDKFVRVRISLDITKSLRQGVLIQPENEEEEEICILLLYERLPNFCYMCEKIGHVLRNCGEQGPAEAETKFGNWMCALSGSGDWKGVNRLVTSPNPSGSTCPNSGI